MEQSSEKYNGWSNYDTWNVALWLANDEWAYIQVTNFLRFLAHRQAKPPEKVDPEDFGRWARNNVFGGSTPDNVKLRPRDTKVNWAEVYDKQWDEVYQQFRRAWAVLEGPWREGHLPDKIKRKDLVRQFLDRNGYSLQAVTAAERSSTVYKRKSFR